MISALELKGITQGEASQFYYPLRCLNEFPVGNYRFLLLFIQQVDASGGGAFTLAYMVGF